MKSSALCRTLTGAAPELFEPLAKGRTQSSVGRNISSLIVIPEHDPLVPADDSDAIETAHPNGKTITVSGSGHSFLFTGNKCVDASLIEKLFANDGSPRPEGRTCPS
jgi:hypothetical protein